MSLGVKSEDLTGRGSVPARLRCRPTLRNDPGRRAGLVLANDRPMRSILSWSAIPVLLLMPSPAAARDVYTPLIVSALQQRTTPVLGTDGQYHAVYELVPVNARPGTATLERVTVADAAAPDGTLATFDAKALAPRIRTLDNRQAPNASLDPNATRLVLLDLMLASSSQLPRGLVHRLDTVVRANPTAASPSPVAYTAAPIAFDEQVLTIAPPLAGTHWVAFNGCCAPGVSHRSTALPVNGRLHFAQRFAIDGSPPDNRGRLLPGHPAAVHSYTTYDPAVLAGADGTVVETLDTLDDQVPGKNPDPATITMDNVDGNHIVVD